MLYNEALIVDYGPQFLGSAVRVDSGILCVIPRQQHTRVASASAMREMVRGLGGDCGDCGKCPLGQAD
ncbi:hypothetical protein [Streptomyces scopuliridis]|uniref:hypothetical protein n=1 Tax=Streptomyces scopuliridis TaxID=452529 RepID=UPI00342A931E